MATADAATTTTSSTVTTTTSTATTTTTIVAAAAADDPARESSLDQLIWRSVNSFGTAISWLGILFLVWIVRRLGRALRYHGLVLFLTLFIFF